MGIKLFTSVEIPKSQEPITYNSKIFLTGSCFADEIGEQLKMYGFDVLVNPFGTLYNARSVFNSIMRLGTMCGMLCAEDSPLFVKEDLFLRPDGFIVTYFHHSRCGMRLEEADPDARGELTQVAVSKFLSVANENLRRSAEFFYKADTVIITLGTSYVYRLANTNFVVSNCHKMPQENFVREFLPLCECADLLRTILESFPRKRFIFTVSPIRHMADGAHGNMLSKSTLHLAVCKASEGNPRATYFPAYEILCDELRDYRWYAEDLVHPSPVAVKYIFERFKESYIAPSCADRMEQELKAYKAKQHRRL